ncbi:alpha/beta fold hydrolase [Mucilaginibacter sp.]
MISRSHNDSWRFCKRPQEAFKLQAFSGESDRCGPKYTSPFRLFSTSGTLYFSANSTAVFLSSSGIQLPSGLLNFPTLIVVGEQDVFTPVATADYMKGYIKNARLGIIPDAGHMPNMEQPEIFNSVLIDFLKTSKILT